MKIIIDPGHGGRWRPNPPKGDPGVVSIDGTKVESAYNFMYATTLREVLVKAGFDVVMTRDHDEHTIDNRLRTKETTQDSLMISLHFDTWQGGKRLIYYAALNPQISEASLKLAEAIDKHVKTGDIRKSTSSRFSRLYIDDSKGAAVLIEVDRIDRADDSEAARTDFANKVLAGINEYLGKKTQLFDTPFQRVFVIENGEQRQLTNIERMSIVGDKLYIALKDE